MMRIDANLRERWIILFDWVDLFVTPADVIIFLSSKIADPPTSTSIQIFGSLDLWGFWGDGVTTSPPRIYTGPQRDGSETAARQL